MLLCQVLSDFSKKKDYDDKLKSEEVKSVYQRTYDASQQVFGLFFFYL